MTQLKYDKEFKQKIIDLLSVDSPKSIHEIRKEYGLKSLVFIDESKGLKQKQEPLKIKLP